MQYGPFVMNTKAEVIEAFEDFQRGRLGRVPAGGIRPYRASASEIAEAKEKRLREAVASMPHGGDIREG